MDLYLKGAYESASIPRASSGYGPVHLAGFKPIHMYGTYVHLCIHVHTYQATFSIKIIEQVDVCYG